MTTTITVDMEKLKTIANETDSAKAVFKYLFDRRRGRQDTNIKRVERLLKESGNEVRAEDVALVFKKLQELGIGKIVFGRRGNPNRFIWTANLRSLKEIVEGRATHMTKQHPTNKKLNLPRLSVADEIVVAANNMEAATVDHSIVVRKGSLEIEVPAMLSAEEAKGIAMLLSFIS